MEEKLKRQWEYLNKLGLYTVEDVIEFDKKLVLDIGTLGCRFTEEEIASFWGGETE